MGVTCPIVPPQTAEGAWFSEKIRTVSELITIEEGRRRVLESVPRLGDEAVILADALGRVLAEEVTSPIAVPPFESSAMDGFAVVAGPGGELEVIGEARAGRPYSGSLSSGSAVRISTGAVVPQGANAVVPIERTTAVKEGGSGDGVRVDPVYRGKVGHDPDSAGTSGDAVGAVVRGAAGLAVAGVKVAGAVTHELLRRLPRP